MLLLEIKECLQWDLKKDVRDIRLNNWSPRLSSYHRIHCKPHKTRGFETTIPYCFFRDANFATNTHDWVAIQSPFIFAVVSPLTPHLFLSCQRRAHANSRSHKTIADKGLDGHLIPPFGHRRGISQSVRTMPQKEIERNQKKSKEKENRKTGIIWFELVYILYQLYTYLGRQVGFTSFNRAIRIRDLQYTF